MSSRFDDYGPVPRAIVRQVGDGPGPSPMYTQPGSQMLQVLAMVLAISSRVQAWVLAADWQLSSPVWRCCLVTSKC
jgi:hypothetical protein